MQIPVPGAIPSYKQECLQRAVAALASLEGVVAVVLGGSYARGTQHANSDLDLGVYYSESAPFAIEEIEPFRSKTSGLDIISAKGHSLCFPAVGHWCFCYVLQ